MTKEQLITALQTLPDGALITGYDTTVGEYYELEYPQFHIDRAHTEEDRPCYWIPVTSIHEPYTD